MYNLYVRVGEFMNHDELKKIIFFLWSQMGKEMADNFKEIQCLAPSATTVRQRNLQKKKPIFLRYARGSCD